jgi:hypothetical protein
VWDVALTLWRVSLLLLERFTRFEVFFQAERIILVQKDRPPWQGRVLFFEKQEDGSFMYSCGIEEQGPAWAFSANTALGWLIARKVFEETDIQLWSEMTGQKQGAD